MLFGKAQSSLCEPRPGNPQSDGAGAPEDKKTDMPPPGRGGDDGAPVTPETLEFFGDRDPPTIPPPPDLGKATQLLSVPAPAA